MNKSHMKRLIICALALATALSCSQKNNCTVDFEIKNCPEAKLVVKYTTPDEVEVADTLDVTEGRAKYSTDIAEPLKASVTVLRDGENDAHLSFIIEPADINVTADMENLIDNGPKYGYSCESVKIEGGRNNAFENGIKVIEDSLLAQPKYAEFALAKAELEKLGRADAELYRAKSKEFREKFADLNSDFYDERMNALAAYVLANTDCEDAAAMYAIYNGQISSQEEFVAGYEAFPESVRNSFLAKRTTEKVAGQKNTLPGAEAPDFTLATPDGSTLTLSSLRGKYVLLDFWGSWCHWCVVAIPTLKDIYSKYSDKMEILSIDCRDTKEQWLKAIEEHGMPWKQVKNEDSDNIPSKYGIMGYPTFIVLDSDGKVVKSFLGETEDFKPFIDSLFTK